ncbi:FAD-linked sulfhydryl oxidase ALR [Daktulosphaira vitifoliae]|uniref:FAD-linked sulfhydryl oxidase ALR n=1 Tax=Daktulosphaira vitifoliae TaxID=58002 RepID=UPI0021AA649C|nr:FAD-linked sulfhydryl oxidase ALR [Daktulosphaira vitifoliae]
MAHDCPLDKDQLGFHSWNLLHTMAAYYPENPSERLKQDMETFFLLIGRLYPCETCARDFAQLIDSKPPDTSSQSALSRWLCWVHNQINTKLGKPLFDCSRVNERWRDGWNDGSCD